MITPIKALIESWEKETLDDANGTNVADELRTAYHNEDETFQRIMNKIANANTEQLGIMNEMLDEIETRMEV